MAHRNAGKPRIGLVVLLAVGIAVVSVMAVGPVLLYGYFGAGDTVELRPSDLRYRLLISGSPIERLGRLEPLSKAIYYYSAQDGTTPETRGLRYRSAATAAALLDYYNAACVAGAFGPDGKVVEQSSTHLLCRSGHTQGTLRVFQAAGASRVVLEILGRH